MDLNRCPELLDHYNHALTLWILALALREVNADPSRPGILWDTDDTPHSWHGHTLPGAGVAGDNADNIYRSAIIDGAYGYEISGDVPDNQAAHFSIEAVHGSPSQIVLTTNDSEHVDMGNQIGLLNDSDIHYTGSRFTITLDSLPANGRPNHLQIAPGPVTLYIRESLSDWRQTPLALSIRRTDDNGFRPPGSEDEIARRVADNLPHWVDFWAKFKEEWLGAPAPNSVVGPLPRDGGWGFAAGGRFDLKDDEALIITLNTKDTHYTGLQILDRWFMAPDSRRYFSSRNNAQITSNPDGTTTYVIAVKDPGVPNWIDTAGFHQGFFVIRWQKLIGAAISEPLVKSYHFVNTADLHDHVSQAGITESDRNGERERRIADYESRLTATI